ncbi:adenylate/guanylate cyclase domain-containing protein [Hyphomicrobium sp.]|uniref:adenylate/guanylate cyclase domain-containing protein n=1 Tax=Hyphomicrobium sp. TaxID=82 RepID=UPI002E34B82E|nr:adenylate/guanylate cyclase domain-containing protein [Hyphomicrobium sp.]HEX2843344.1 adenylate/guanylate cyclase domain-containing protein [Hyphomicrobium sp.]
MHVLKRGDALQLLRLASGLILFLFAATHFLNHALGLISVDLMQEVQQWRWAVTRSLPGTIVLASALVIHVSLALFKLAQRTTLRMPPWEFIQLALGLSIPFLLLPHIVNTRIAHDYFGVNDIYAYELIRLWPDSAVTQSVLLLLVWIHGCIGLHFWLRLAPQYRRFSVGLLALAIFVPLAALGGFYSAGRGMAQVIQDPAIFSNIKTMTHWPSEKDFEALARYRSLVRTEYIILLGVVAGYFLLTYFSRLTGPKVRVSYVGGPTVTAPEGPTLLEISRNAKVPHASVCGGRARCSTCRVRIEKTSTPLPLPRFPEVVTLASIGAPENVRLACQIRPQGHLTVSRILRPGSTGPEAVALSEEHSTGAEKSLAVMFVDLRDFTRLAEKRLPFDIVFILNEFFGVVGTAIVGEGGRIDKFLGDGLLAVFGEQVGLAAGCRQALRAARAIDLALDHVNAKLEEEVGRSLRVGIGVDAGTLVVGRIGFGEMVDFTVIGTPVNVASRLESLTKETSCQIMLSRAVAEHAGWAPTTEFTTTIQVRGVADPVDVIGIVRGRDLPASILSATSDTDVAARTAATSQV